MYTKILEWIKENDSLSTINNRSDNSGWSIEIDISGFHLYLYSTEENTVKIESILKFPYLYVDKAMINSLYNEAFSEGCYISEVGSYMNDCIIRLGYSIHDTLLTKKSLLLYTEMLIRTYRKIEEFVIDYVSSNNIMDLDVSMFMGDGANIEKFNIEAMIRIKDTKFQGSWEIFKENVKMIDEDKSRELIECIDKCIEFEKINDRRLSDVYGKVKEEIKELTEELKSNVTFN